MPCVPYPEKIFFKILVMLFESDFLKNLKINTTPYTVADTDVCLSVRYSVSMTLRLSVPSCLSGLWLCLFMLAKGTLCTRVRSLLKQFPHVVRNARFTRSTIFHDHLCLKEQVLLRWKATRGILCRFICHSERCFFVQRCVWVWQKIHHAFSFPRGVVRGRTIAWKTDIWVVMYVCVCVFGREISVFSLTRFFFRNLCLFVSFFFSCEQHHQSMVKCWISLAHHSAVHLHTCWQTNNAHTHKHLLSKNQAPTENTGCGGGWTLK